MNRVNRQMPSLLKLWRFGPIRSVFIIVILGTCWHLARPVDRLLQMRQTATVTSLAKSRLVIITDMSCAHVRRNHTVIALYNILTCTQDSNEIPIFFWVIHSVMNALVMQPAIVVIVLYVMTYISRLYMRDINRRARIAETLCLERSLHVHRQDSTNMAYF